jgi:dipeptidyl aminopeptidase/acylaminoacyl peptidase
VTAPEDLAGLVGVRALALDPSGRRLAVATRRADLVTDTYDDEVRLFERNGEHWLERAVPRLVGGSPSWAPDGKVLALVERGAAGTARLCLHDLEARRSASLLEWPDELDGLAWSPSGRFVGFVARARRATAGVVLTERGAPPRVVRHLQFRADTVGWLSDRPRHCYAVALEDPTKVHNLSGTDFDDADLVWLGSDDRYAFVSRRHDGAEWDLVSDVFAGILEDLALQHEGRGSAPLLRQVTGSDRQWGPLAFDAVERELYGRYALVREFPCDEKLARIDLAAAAPSGVAALVDTGVERSLTGPLVVHRAEGTATTDSQGGGSPVELFSLLANSGSVELVKLAAAAGARATGEPPRALAGELTCATFDVAGGYVAAAASVRGGPLELLAFPVDRPSHEPTAPITRLHDRYRDETGWIEPLRVPAVAQDGTELDCWVLLPGPQTELAGGVLYVPGGGAQFGWSYEHDMQVLASAGLAVIFGNARGSGGYGESWMRTVCGPNSAFPGTGWGGVDRSDLLALVSSALSALPRIDPAKLAVMGGSYGGLMAALLGFSTRTFAAVVAERGAFDLAAMAATSDEGSWFFDAYIGATADEDPEQYRFSSVTSYVDGVCTPVLILHSEEDLRCPIQQAEELFSALRRRGADVTFVRFPGESHELSRSGSPVHRVQRIQIIRDWLVARLAGKRAAFELEA